MREGLSRFLDEGKGIRGEEIGQQQQQQKDFCMYLLGGIERPSKGKSTLTVE